MKFLKLQLVEDVDGLGHVHTSCFLNPAMVDDISDAQLADIVRQQLKQMRARNQRHEQAMRDEVRQSGPAA